MHRSSPYGYQFGKGGKDYGKNKYDSCGKGRNVYGKGSMSSIMLESMSDRIDQLEKTSEKLQLENDRLKEDYQALLDSEHLLEVENDIMKLENDRLQSENCKLQSDRMPIELKKKCGCKQQTACRPRLTVCRSSWTAWWLRTNGFVMALPSMPNKRASLRTASTSWPTRLPPFVEPRGSAVGIRCPLPVVWWRFGISSGTCPRTGNGRRRMM